MIGTVRFKHLSLWNGHKWSKTQIGTQKKPVRVGKCILLKKDHSLNWDTYMIQDLIISDFRRYMSLVTDCRAFRRKCLSPWSLSSQIFVVRSDSSLKLWSSSTLVLVDFGRGSYSRQLYSVFLWIPSFVIPQEMKHRSLWHRISPYFPIRPKS